MKTITDRKTLVLPKLINLPPAFSSVSGDWGGNGGNGRFGGGGGGAASQPTVPGSGGNGGAGAVVLSFFNGMTITNATYGGNCNAALAGNATTSIGTACDGLSSCSYLVTTDVLGDPAGGCAKTFVVDYTCGGGTLTYTVNPEASGQTAVFSCP
jgi:hypothetical protein